MGFNIGDGKTFYSHQASLTGNITQLQDTSNVNITGRWMFRVDATDIGDEISCDKSKMPLVIGITIGRKGDRNIL